MSNLLVNANKLVNVVVESNGQVKLTDHKQEVIHTLYGVNNHDDDEALIESFDDIIFDHYKSLYKMNLKLIEVAGYGSELNKLYVAWVHCSNFARGVYATGLDEHEALEEMQEADLVTFNSDNEEDNDLLFKVEEVVNK